MSTAHNADVEIAYELVHETAGTPLLLVCGSSMQLIHWPDRLLDGAAERGFQVARFDNRDAGRSTHCDDRPAYTLRDLADDAVAVMDALGWGSAHVLGVSLGGMVGQVMAVRHPDRVRSLTSVSAAPAWSLRVSRPRLRTLLKAARLGHRPVAGKQAAVEVAVEVYRLLGMPADDEPWIREVAARAYDIAYDPAGERRQMAAAGASGDRRVELARVRVPTLVVHGADDPMQSPAAGRATARAIPGSRLLVLPNAGHVLPAGAWPVVLDELCTLIAGPRRSGRTPS